METENSKSKQLLTGFVSLCREILLRFIQQHFPTMIENHVSSISLGVIVMIFTQRTTVPKKAIKIQINSCPGKWKKDLTNALFNDQRQKTELKHGLSHFYYCIS